MIASLPMYWRPETGAAWRNFWRGVQEAVPEMALPGLTPPEDLPSDWGAHWTAADLVLSQTCGLPFRDALKGRAQYVATFDYGLDGPPGHYLSHQVVRADRSADFQPRRLAYNNPDSQSGWAASGAGFTDVLETGAHWASAHAVAEGAADVAFIDAVTWRLLERFSDVTARLRIVSSTPATPGLPLITALERDPEPLRGALFSAVEALSAEDRDLMGGLRGLVVLDEADYYAIPVPPPPPKSLQA